MDSTGDVRSCQKRRFSDSEDSSNDSLPVEAKQRRREVQYELGLLHLCDELLYCIFKYLDSWSIYAVMNCSLRFESLLLDHRFWHNIDLSNRPLPMGILVEILGRATEKTHTIKVCGPPSAQHVAGEFKQFTFTLTSVFTKVPTQLQVLELEGISLDFEYINIADFPASLTRLVLKDCSVKVGDQVKSIFHTIEEQLVDLKDLSIEDNSWFEPHYIMALSKLPSLKRLSLKGCQLLSKFVPYGSMAARFGFRKLEVLDLRFTPINNSDLQCFGAIESLRELLLETQPQTTAEGSDSDKTSNGNAEELSTPTTASSATTAAKTTPTQQYAQATSQLNDDEPSTSRAALEHMRVCLGNRSMSEKFPKVSDDEKPAKTDPRPMAVFDSDDDDDDENSNYESDAQPERKPEENESPAVGNNTPNHSNTTAEAAASDTRQNPVPTPRAYVYVPGLGTGPEMAAHAYDNMVSLCGEWRGNQPGHCRFLPRRDHIIIMKTLREPIVMRHSHARVPPSLNYGHVVQHPMFWNMLDPLGRDCPRRIGSRMPASCVQPQYNVSDRAIYSFGRTPNRVQSDVIRLGNINRPQNNQLERILLRNYQHITNHTLEHLVQCSPNLVYIDVSGTSINLVGVHNFKKLKPLCQVVAEHLTMDGGEDDELAKPGPSEDHSSTPSNPARSSPPPPSPEPPQQ